MKINYSILDKLINDNAVFAIYRLPESEKIYLIIQQDESVVSKHSIADLNETSGFVISPFAISENCPIVVIHPDIQLKGEEEINEFSKKYIRKKLPNDRRASTETSTSREQYNRMFDAFQNELNAGVFEKLVLSRKQSYPKPEDLSFGKLFSNALSSYPNTFVYLTHTPITGTWLGSTPELFLSEKEDTFHTVALAGTQLIENKNESKNLTWNEKNIKEQQIVAKYMREQLSEQNILFTESQTYTFFVGNLAHLKTDFAFQKLEETTTAHILETIHPTPAVCGLPKEKAFEFINREEKHSRSYYSGFIGNLNMNRRTALYVNLRCMQIANDSVILYAGGGILTSSTRDEEWLETEAKMQTMLGILP